MGYVDRDFLKTQITNFADKTNRVFATKNEMNERTIDYSLDNTGTGANIIGGFSGGSSLHKYSTEEQIVGEWIDGKPIYEKTLIINNYKYGESTKYAHNIPNIDFAFIEKAILQDTLSSANYYGTTNFPVVGMGGSVGITVNETYLFFHGSDYWAAQTNRTSYITVQYTKTTD